MTALGRRLACAIPSSNSAKQQMEQVAAENVRHVAQGLKALSCVRLVRVTVSSVLKTASGKNVGVGVESLVCVCVCWCVLVCVVCVCDMCVWHVCVACVCGMCV